MKHKVSELTGTLLDAAVAKALGWTEWTEYGKHFGLPVWNTADEESTTHSTFRPSQQWSDGGPIIEREKITISPSGSEWCASILLCDAGDTYGPTPLIAAMRAFVASKFGEEVEL